MYLINLTFQDNSKENKKLTSASKISWKYTQGVYTTIIEIVETRNS